MKRKNTGGDGSDYMDGLLNKWANNRQILHGRTKGVDGPKGHMALSCSLCGPQEILNGNDLRLTVNPSP